MVRPSFQQGYARHAGESAAPELWQGLVGAWVPALGPSGDKLPDLSRRGNNAVLTGMANTWQVDSGLHSPSLSLTFDGTNDHLVLDSGIAAKGSGATIIIVFRRDALDAEYDMLISKVSNPHMYIRLLNSTTIRVQTDVISTFKDYTVPEMSLSTWYHLALIRQANSTHVYLDAVESTSGGQTQTDDITISYIFRYDTAYVQGKLQQCLVWDRPLPPPAISDHYQDPMAMFRLRQPIYKAPAAVGGLSIPIAMHHYNQMSGVR
jgi:hypothetical protein